MQGCHQERADGEAVMPAVGQRPFPAVMRRPVSAETIRLRELGFGYERSDAMALKATGLVGSIFAFDDAMRARGFELRAFHGRGRSCYYQRLRIMVVTGKRDNDNPGPSGFYGPIVSVEVGATWLTKAQMARIDEAIRALEKAISERAEYSGNRQHNVEKCGCLSIDNPANSVELNLEIDISLTHQLIQRCSTCVTS